jgi:hypothetical protein
MVSIFGQRGVAVVSFVVLIIGVLTYTSVMADHAAISTLLP